MKTLWLRSETRPIEKRTPLIPMHAGILAKNGYTVIVESSSKRCFNDLSYKQVGCRIVPEYSWPQAPSDSYILGIKELAPGVFPLRHKHLYFAHVYREQYGSKMILQRYFNGGGTLLDLEYLVNFKNEELVTKKISFWAGVCGAAITLFIWAQKMSGVKAPFQINESYDKFENLFANLRVALSSAPIPSVLLVGPSGMTGTGVRFLLDKLNLNYSPWTRSDTRVIKGKEALDFNILLNCIRVDRETKVFISPEQVRPESKLSVIGDISCDSTSPYNPIPLYAKSTTFENPTVSFNGVDIMAIDNLPTLLPKESSEALAEELFPYLCQLLLLADDFRYTPWEKVLAEFNKHIIKGM